MLLNIFLNIKIIIFLNKKNIYKYTHKNDLKPNLKNYHR